VRQQLDFGQTNWRVKEERRQIVRGAEREAGMAVLDLERLRSISSGAEIRTMTGIPLSYAASR
jgi:hypothetical protein